MSKDRVFTMSVRLTGDNKKALDKLALSYGISLNQAVNNLISEEGKTDQLREELNSLKLCMAEHRKQLEALNEKTSVIDNNVNKIGGFLKATFSKPTN